MSAGCNGQRWRSQLYPPWLQSALVDNGKVVCSNMADPERGRSMDMSSIGLSHFRRSSGEGKASGRDLVEKVDVMFAGKIQDTVLIDIIYLNLFDVICWYSFCEWQPGESYMLQYENLLSMGHTVLRYIAESLFLWEMIQINLENMQVAIYRNVELVLSEIHCST